MRHVMETTSIPASDEPVRYRVTGMDCTSCATKIENAAGQVNGVGHVKVSIAAQIMTLRVDRSDRVLGEVERVVTALGYKIDRIDAARAGIGTRVASDAATPTHVTASYKRALWIVVLLNLGYGVAELVGSLVADSQAVQADALDFVGDGVISWLGLVAVTWSLTSRARAALLQGIFLGVLGLGVLAATSYRVLVTQQPEHFIMGAFALAALCVNVLAAIVLLPHRHGDANTRAIWLFSRNDAIGNFAVVIAAALVWWTRTPWPDLLVAFVVAGLFLQSSWSIVRDARSELRQASSSPADGLPGSSAG
jgi:Co/Zn/Cd efflux system component/copper chaperone CopZ